MGTITLAEQSAPSAPSSGNVIIYAKTDNALYYKTPDGTEVPIALAVPRGYIAGLTIANNGSDATNDIDFSAGSARDSTDVANLTPSSGMTKQLDVAWAAGTNQGGRMSAAAIANTTYHCYVIKKDSDGSFDFGFDTSATAPTMPTGYTYFRRIASIVRASATIVAFSQFGDQFLLVTPVLDVSTTVGTSAALQTLDSIPTGVKMWPVINARLIEAASRPLVYLSSPDATDQAPSGSASPLATVQESGSVGFPSVGLSFGLGLRTNTSAQIRARSSVAATSIRIVTLGWVDNRGKDSIP